MKYILFTLVNWINKVLEIVEGNEKTIAPFKRVITKRNKLGFKNFSRFIVNLSYNQINSLA